MAKLTPAQFKAFAKISEAFHAAGKPVYSETCGVSRGMARKLEASGLLTEHIRTVGIENGFPVQDSLWSVTP